MRRKQKENTSVLSSPKLAMTGWMLGFVNIPGLVALILYTQGSEFG